MAGPMLPYIVKQGDYLTKLAFVNGFDADAGFTIVEVVVASTLLLIAFLCIYAQSRVASEVGKFSTVTGKGFRPRVMNIGAWRYLTAAIFVTYFLFIVALPFLVLVWCSLQKFYSAPTLSAMQNLTFDSYRAVFDYPNIGTVIWNSAVLATATATIIMLVTSVLAWIVIRTRLPGRWIIDSLTSLPIVFPTYTSSPVTGSVGPA